jgi:hypothetical protein
MHWTDLVMRAAFVHKVEITIRVRFDNSTTVFYINRVGDPWSYKLILTFKIDNCCKAKNISLQAQQLPRVFNVIADREFRRRID